MDKVTCPECGCNIDHKASVPDEPKRKYGYIRWYAAERGHNFIAALNSAVVALDLVVDLWDEDSVVNYPSYLPSFDEFVCNMRSMLEVSKDV